MKNNKGLTLLELVIVLAIIAIIALILVPSFLLTTDRARLRADIQSANVIQNAIDLYRIERGVHVEGHPNDIDKMVENLALSRYISARNNNPQTAYAVWEIRDNRVVVNISDSRISEDIHTAYESLTDEEKEYVHTGR
jgi:prepilin-type N-terminal cleavage/methylation domain-containing protein